MPYEQNATALAGDNYCLMANQCAAEQLSTKIERQCEKGEYWCIPDKPEAPPLQQQQTTTLQSASASAVCKLMLDHRQSRTENHVLLYMMHGFLLGFLRVYSFRYIMFVHSRSAPASGRRGLLGQQERERRRRRLLGGAGGPGWR